MLLLCYCIQLSIKSRRKTNTASFILTGERAHNYIILSHRYLPANVKFPVVDLETSTSGNNISPRLWFEIAKTNNMKNELIGVTGRLRNGTKLQKK